MNICALTFPTEFKDLVTIIQSGFTIAAMIVGGIWTYHKFIKKREHYPRINLSFTIDSMAVNETHNLVHVAVLHENKGETLMEAKSAEMRLRHVLPLPVAIKKDLNAGNDPISEDFATIEWPMLMDRNWTFSRELPFEIEPGESDSLHADFFVDKNVKTVQFYFFIANMEKKEKNLGWALTWYYQIPSTDIQKHNPMNRLSDQRPKNEMPNRERPEQQKQQRQQAPQPVQPVVKPVRPEQPREPIKRPK